MNADPRSWDVAAPGLFAIAAAEDEVAYFFEILKSGPVVRYCGKESSFTALYGELQGGDLFSSPPLLLISNTDSYSDKEIAQLLAIFKSFDPSSGVRAIFGFSSIQKSRVRALFEAIGTRATFLSEKPWERSGRKRAELIRMLKEKGRSMSMPAIERFESLGFSPLIRLREIEKLIAFAGDRTQLEVSDIDRLCLSPSESSAWKMLDYLIEQRFDALTDLIAGSVFDVSSLLSLIFPLRHQLAQSCAIVEGRSDYLKKKYPYLVGSRLQKSAERLKRVCASHMEHLYGQLIDFEVFVKRSALDITSLRSLLALLLRGEAWAS